MQRKQSQSYFRLAPALGRWSASILFGMVMAATAETLPMPSDGSDLVGEIRYATARQEDTLIDIARRYSVGQDEIVMANPTVDRWLPKAGTRVLLPKRMILPDAPHAGVVVNIPEMRLYYYPVKYAPAKARPKPVAAKAPAKPLKPGEKAAPAPKPKPQPVAELGEPIGAAGEVITYPISIGRMDWHTPLGKTRIVAKVKDPVWVPPASIKKEHAEQGEILPDVVPAGPDNPLGQFAMRLGVAGYLIHGVDRAKADGIGMRVTHGCVRMYPEDVEKLFNKVSVGTPVYMVNQPIKLGWDNGSLYMEVHQPLDEDSMSSSQLYSMAMELIQKKTASRPVELNREAIRKATDKPSGLPVEIGRAGIAPLEAEPGGYAPEPAADTAAPRPYRADPYAAPPARPYSSTDETPAPAPRPYAPATRPVDPYSTAPRPARPYTPAPPAEDTYEAEDAPAAAGTRRAPGATAYPYGAAPAAPSTYRGGESAAGYPRPATPAYGTGAPPRYQPAPRTPAADPYATEDAGAAGQAGSGYGSSRYGTAASRYPASGSGSGADPYSTSRTPARAPANDPYQAEPAESAEPTYDPYGPYDGDRPQ